MKKSLLVTLLILLPLASPCFADTFQLTLKSGYNYISIPIGSSWNIKSILDQVSAATKQAAYWNPDTAGYIRYANDPAFDQFSTFEYAKGYWVLLNSSQNTTLILNGTTPTDYTLVLKKGWDAIGCPRNREIAVEDALAPLRMGVDYASVWRFNPLAGYEQYSASIKQFTTLKPGEGYWIRMSKDTSWHIVNRAPVLDTIGNKTVAENQKLEFVISATDPDNDPLTYSATNLPSGASFNSATRTFSWTPDGSQSGTYLNINFTVSDGLLTDSQAISIIVNDVTVPRIDSFYPAGGSTLFDEWTDFTASCSDADGYQDISEAGILVNTSQSAVRCLDSLFDFAANKIYLRNDTDTAWLGGFAPGSNNIIENSYCKLDCAKFTVSGSGNALQINGSFSYKFAFAGIRPKNVYVYVKDNANNFTGWVKQGAVSIQAAASKPFLNSAQYSLLDEFLNIHLNYFLSSEVITSSGLPFGAYSELDPTKFGYSNPTEWGYALLAWIIAADTGKITKEDAVNRINVMLQTLQSLQNNSAQNYHKLFYAYYHLLEPEGVHHDSNHDIPSIDNGFLYTSLWILQGWAKVNSFSAVENSANSIKNAMDFKVFLPSSKTYIAHTINADSNIFSSLTWNVFSDEGGAMAWIAYLSDAVTLHEYKVIVENMMRSQSSWNSITVAEAPWFNAMFTWAVRSLAGFPVASWETPGLNNNYSSFSFAPSVKAHLAYGDLLGIGYPAFSDAMTQPNMTKRYTPPNISNTVPTDIPNHVVPHAFFVPLCIGPDLEPAVLNTLFSKISDLKSDQAGYYHNGQDYHKPFGFEVTASPFKNKTDYVGVEKRFVFETLSQAYIALSIYQGLAINNGGPTLFHYASRLPGYMDKISGVLDYLCNYTPVTIRVPQDYPIIQQAVNAALHGDTIIVSAGEYQENIVANSKNNVTIRGVIADPDNPLNSGANTVINGNKKQVINLGSSNGIVLDSLVITAGVPFDHNTDYSISAGGVYCTGENVVIKNNIILNNKGYSGAGICAIGRNVRIENNLIKDNNASSGGGVYVSAGSGGTAVVCKNKILNNHSWSAGGGLYINSGNVSVYQNIVFGNCSDSSAGMYLFLITGEINNNIIAQNYTECFSGGGIYCDNSAILIANNVIYRNSAISWPQSKCGGVYISGTNTPIVKNNIITENYKGGIYYNGTSTCLLTYNDVYSNTNDGDNYNGCSAGEGAISSQPLFVSPDNGDGDPLNDDYYLVSGSQCINAGDLDAQYNDADGTRSDMGAYGGPGGNWN